MSNPKRQPAGATSAVKNDILRALLNTEYRRLRPLLTRVDLKAGDVIYRADQRIRYVYFPETAVVAMVDIMENGSTVEVGSIGHEGLVGINIFLGSIATPDKAVVILAGSAMRMKTTDLRIQTRFGSPLQRLLLRYTRALLAVISQSVGCSQHHTALQRMARLLVTMHYYAEAREFEMSQEFIASMLGVRRGAVNEAARQLQAAGLIRYRRSRMRVIDSTGVRKESCECYRFIRKQFDQLLIDVPRFLSNRL